MGIKITDANSRRTAAMTNEATPSACARRIKIAPVDAAMTPTKRIPITGYLFEIFNCDIMI